jgi:glycosidase
MIFEFHVSRAARDKYKFDEVLFSTNGTVVFANVAAAREFARKMNAVRDSAGVPDQVVHAGALNAMGLIDEALHVLLALYREQRDPAAITDALTFLDSRLSPTAVDKLLVDFADEFPSVSVYRGQQSASEWLKGSTEGIPHRNIALEEALFLWLANANPAFNKYRELFDDTRLTSSTDYSQLAPLLRAFFETRPRFGPEDLNVIDLLRAPALASPDSLAGQLAYIRERWKPVLGSFIERLARAAGVLQEEEIAVWMQHHPPAWDRPFGGGVTGDSSAAAIPRFETYSSSTNAAGEPEYERFSPDVDWMPRTVMIAKSAYVWLHQLCNQYRRDISRLDQVPDEELDLFARRGFNAVWIIGIWQRSKASQRIKQLTGNPEAGASAYSLNDYAIADDLGGEGAYNNLRDRAAARGIRLASDMVPNHMGIDSRWVMEHPNWFISLPYPPFPVYRFDGPDVGGDGRVEVKIEDHYYDRSDASVVFMRRDRWSGDTCFVYHGNDGTSFPWNDTAQLNYLMPEVREAVIQTILHVARQFPIIRFDAAMTLTKKHYQRLWYPQPGTGSAIASRAEFGLTKEQFDTAMPNEFWREVVDRVAAEAPGTLLLAEAFWLLEGYFVRTLGMHRVYNSAFMNMLRDEENANYRSVIKNTLEFDPEVLKRYVNFMSNPDERTAIDQFGKGDKYFGVCTLLATMPGLPMFGHGQIEGYTERYGMEYQRSYFDERPDQWLVARHEREISPLLHRRHLFAEVRDFLLYDFYSDDGRVNEDVYAYSNQSHGERALVLFHNRYGTTRGWIRMSASYAEKTGDGDRQLRQRSMGEAFELSGDTKDFIVFRDAITGLEYLHRSSALREQGIHLELGAYRCHVFLDWREVRDEATRPWSALCDKLQGRGVTSLEDELRAIELEPVHTAVFALLEPPLIEELVAAATVREFKPAKAPSDGKKPEAKAPPVVLKSSSGNGDQPGSFDASVEQAALRLRSLLTETRHFSSGPAAIAAGMGDLGAWRGDINEAVRGFVERLQAAARLTEVEAEFSQPWPKEACAVLPSCTNAPKRQAPAWAMLISWAAMEAIGNMHTPRAPERPAEIIFERLRLRHAIAESLEKHGLEGDDRWRGAALIRTAFAHAVLAPKPEEGTTRPVRLTWLHDPEVAWLLGVHEYEGVRYLVREPFERLLWWMSLRSLLDLAAEEKPDPDKIQDLERALGARVEAAEKAGYNVEVLLDEPVKTGSKATRDQRENEPTTPKAR